MLIGKTSQYNSACVKHSSFVMFPFEAPKNISANRWCLMVKK